jgi:hypothetical protein
MSIRFLTLAIAAAGLALIAGQAVPASAGPGLVAVPEAGTALVQEAGYYKRRYRYRNDTYVRAPFTRVYTSRWGTWVRAPFVNLWVPR